MKMKISCLAGLLHDTIEDCEPYGSVTEQTLAALFGIKVATLVNAVTEQDKSLSWEERKTKALDHIAKMDHDTLLLKSADLLDNLVDLTNGVEKYGLAFFQPFARGPEVTIQQYTRVFAALDVGWHDNPLLPEIHENLTVLQNSVNQ